MATTKKVTKKSRRKEKISVSIPATLLKEMESFIDGVTIRNKSHLVHSAIVEWMEAKRKTGKGQQLKM